MPVSSANRQKPVRTRKQGVVQAAISSDASMLTGVLIAERAVLDADDEPELLDVPGQVGEGAAGLLRVRRGRKARTSGSRREAGSGSGLVPATRTAALIDSISSWRRACSAEPRGRLLPLRSRRQRLPHPAVEHPAPRRQTHRVPAPRRGRPPPRAVRNATMLRAPRADRARRLVLHLDEDERRPAGVDRHRQLVGEVSELARLNGSWRNQAVAPGRWPRRGAAAGPATCAAARQFCLPSTRRRAAAWSRGRRSSGCRCRAARTRYPAWSTAASGTRAPLMHSFAL